MKNNLILITSSFPYGDGEQFIETEIVYLSKHFKTITIIPMSIHGSKRIVPKNVFIDEEYTILRLKYLNKKLFRLFNLLRSSYCYKELFLNLKKILNIFNLKSMIGELSSALFFSDYLNKYKQDYKIYYSYWNGSTALALMLFKKEQDIKVVSRVHKGELYEELHKYNYLPYRKIIYQNLTEIYSISQDGISYIKDKYKLNNKNIYLSRLGVKKQNFITKISSKDNFVIVSCSNFVEEKRFGLVIDTIKSFARSSNLNIEWFHIGAGEGFEYYKKRAYDNLEINLNIEFLGHLKNIEVLNFYKIQEIDIFINLSSSEGIPVSIMEAQSCSIPVIATNVGGVAEIVNDSNGYLLDKNFDIDIAVGFLNQISLDKKLLLEKKRKSYENWEKNYNAEKNYNSFIKKLGKLS